MSTEWHTDSSSYRFDLIVVCVTSSHVVIDEKNGLDKDLVAQRHELLLAGEERQAKLL